MSQLICPKWLRFLDLRSNFAFEWNEKRAATPLSPSAVIFFYVNIHHSSLASSKTSGLYQVSKNLKSVNYFMSGVKQGGSHKTTRAKRECASEKYSCRGPILMRYRNKNIFTRRVYISNSPTLHPSFGEGPMKCRPRNFGKHVV